MGMSYFIFGGIDTRTYTGIYVAPVEVDNTPKRVYKAVDIPAKNGKFYIDEHRFEDVEHSYYIIALTKSIGVQLINALSSKVGHCRLEDSFNTGEYYEAVFTSGAEVKITPERVKNKFKITFTRKPQRWLTSGETAQTVANEGVLTNPTLFESEPLLAVKGYGTIGFNGYEIELENAMLGDVVLFDGGRLSSVDLDESNLNTGDTITVSGSDQYMRWEASTQDRLQYKSSQLTIAISCSNSDFSLISAGLDYLYDTKYYVKVSIALPTFDIIVGTDSTVTNTVSGTITTRDKNYNAVVFTLSYTQTFTYDASEHKLTFGITNVSISCSDNTITTHIKTKSSPQYNNIIGHSTVSLLGNPTYVDCSIGECYRYNNDEVVSLNSKIDLGSDLPKLASGANTFTYDNTVTELKVTPRWWGV